MIKFEHTQVAGWEAAIRGMRNPLNSWDRSDSNWIREILYADHESVDTVERIHIGPNDHDLMMRLAGAGSVDAKFRRMIVVYVDITAPLYWWKEFDTYKIGTVANSCSTMHKITANSFGFDDFSHEKLNFVSKSILGSIIKELNNCRELYNTPDEEWNVDGMKELGFYSKKDIWWQMIQLLPSSYNQKRTVMLNYEVLAGIYPKRKNHKLDEWHDFCTWIEKLPYSEMITGGAE